MCGIIYIFEGNVWNKSSSMQSKTVLATCSKLVHTAIDSNPPRPMNMDMHEAIVYISVQTTVEKNIYFCQKTHHSQSPTQSSRTHQDMGESSSQIPQNWVPKILCTLLREYKLYAFQMIDHTARATLLHSENRCLAHSS